MSGRTNHERMDDLHARMTDVGITKTGRLVPPTSLVVMTLDDLDKLLASVELLHGAWKAAEPMVTFFEDLDRNQFGVRHGERIDGDGTWSQGNPFLFTGQVIGFGAAGAGRTYMVPPPGERADIENWVKDLRKGNE